MISGYLAFAWPIVLPRMDDALRMPAMPVPCVMACLMGISLISDLPGHPMRGVQPPYLPVFSYLRYLGQWQNTRPGEFPVAMAWDAFHKLCRCFFIPGAEDEPRKVPTLTMLPWALRASSNGASIVYQRFLFLLVDGVSKSAMPTPPSVGSALPAPQTDDGLACATPVCHNPAKGDRITPKRCDIGAAGAPNDEDAHTPPDGTPCAH